MPARKRTITELEAPAPEATKPVDPVLLKLRNTWEFACLIQYIFLFGEAVKIDKEIDIDMLEMECCRPEPTDLLPKIGLALLKNVSSHRGLTPELFDEYTRRQYTAKAPQRNPYGTDEVPNKFADFDVFQRIRILHQLSVWTLYNPDRIRTFYQDEVSDMTSWRIEEFGWDKHDRTYFVLDDNRLYRMTKPQIIEPPKPKPKSKSKPAKKPAKGSRSSKRQKLANGEANESEEENEHLEDHEPSIIEQHEDADNGLGGSSWECIAITLEEYTDFMDTIRKSKDPDEKELIKRINEHVLPELERHAAARERKAAAQRRELLALQLQATAKRSSRIAGKQEKIKEQQEAEEEEQRRKEELEMARRELDKQKKMEEDRESRMMTREQRLKDREVKRILQEEAVRKLQAESQSDDTVEGRMSERHRKAELEKRRQALEKLVAEEEDWYFDCAICGVHGKNLDDGTHSLACEKCNVWQHSACHGIKEADAEREDFKFLCATCSKPRQIKIKVTSADNSPHAPQQQTSLGGTAEVNGGSQKKKKSANAPRPKQAVPPTYHWNTSQTSPSNGVPGQQPNGYRIPMHQTPYQSFQPYNPPSMRANGYPPQYNFMPGAQARQAAPPGSFPGRSVQLTPQGQTHHNPFLNDLGRQRPVASAAPHHSPIPLSPQAYQGQSSRPPQQTFATPYATSGSQYQATPQSSGQAPSIASSPTPSLAATQGNTGMRFSPTTQASTSNAYIPNNNQPAAAAMSPVKQASPPPACNGRAAVYQSNAPFSNVAGSAPPLYSSSPNSSGRIAGASPVKHDVPPSSAPQSSDSNATAFPVQLATTSMPLVKTSPIPTQLTPTPALQPNVGLQNGTGRALEPPIKKMLSPPSPHALPESSPRIAPTVPTGAIHQTTPVPMAPHTSSLSS